MIEGRGRCAMAVGRIRERGMMTWDGGYNLRQLLIIAS